MDGRNKARRPGVMLVLVSLVAALALVVAGCGGSDDDTTASGGADTTEAAGGSGGAGLAKAEEVVGEYEGAPESIGITEPLKAKPEAGKRITMVACNLAPCKALFEGGKEAAAALGWKAKAIVTTGEPEDLNKKLGQAISEKPDGILVSGFSREVFEESMQKAEAAGIPIVSSGVPDEVESPYIAVTTNTPVFERNGEILGDWIAVDSAGEAKVAIFNVPIFPILTAFSEAVQTSLGEACDCEAKIVDQQVTDIGTSLPKNVVSTLQTDPDISYVVFPDGSFAAGVVAALRDAGLEDVKLVGQVPGEANLAELQRGDEDAYMGYSTEWISWAGFDSFARFFQDMDPKNDPLAAPTQILTPENVEGDEPWTPEGYQEQFEALWKLG